MVEVITVHVEASKELFVIMGNTFFVFYLSTCLPSGRRYRAKATQTIYCNYEYMTYSLSGK